MNIRKVRQEDNLQLAKIIREIFEEFGAPKQGSVYSDEATNHLDEVFQQDKSVLWVTETDGRILGSCGIYPTDELPDGYVELVKFYLASGARGKGIGKKLIEESIESAKQSGYKAIYIESFPEFENAVRIYENLGFNRLSHPLGNSGHTACTIWMVKELDSISRN
ncbi:MAG: acetyltransferase, family protein [Bacteroidetes bacterium]|nr:acetyltransferase, family protein [Bacteroidota bacterium]